MQGEVILVGAGPSNIELLTIGGKKAIESAEVVVFDRLVSKEILDLIPENAKKIDVGKNVGHHPVKQEEINQILVDEAKLGNRVVRLKGGDSFLFGRGGEEVQKLIENGIKYKVISGVSSSLSVPTYAGIPVTHRDFCSSVHIITGHARAGAKLDIDFEALVRLNGTLVFMMSVKNSPEIMQGLMNAGMSEDMPVAIIENGTTNYQRKVITTTGNLHKDIVKNDIKSHAIVVVGRVCSLDFDWFSKLPLFSKKILVTRPKKDADKMANALRENGACVTIASTIDTHAVDFELPNLSSFDTIIFTSANGVCAFFGKVYKSGIDARDFSHVKFAVIGNSTKKELLKYGIVADFTPSKFDGETLGKQMIFEKFIDENSKILIIRGNLCANSLQNVLNNSKIDFSELICYNTTYEKPCDIDIKSHDIVTFTSASSVKAFVECFDDFSHLTAFCIGDMTENEAKKYGFTTKKSEKATIDSMIDGIKEYFVC